MSETAKLRMYGENAATFVIFQSLAKTPGAIRDVLLPNLKLFGHGRAAKAMGRNWSAENAEVWLFPCFGKRDGFCEPDVLVFAGDEVFWIEVETRIDCQRDLTGLRQSLYQLGRFRCLQDAIRQPPRAVRGSLRIEGPVWSKTAGSRNATLKIAGHGLLQGMRDRLAKAGKEERDHYILFSVRKPAGEGAGGRRYCRVLADEAALINASGSVGVAPLPLDRCWYSYWKADLSADFKGLDLDDEYVGRKPRPGHRRPSR